jgi:hypothetical protein
LAPSTPAADKEEAKKTGPKTKKVSKLSDYRNTFMRNVTANNKSSIIG